jgi:hypothetical protein
VKKDKEEGNEMKEVLFQGTLFLYAVTFKIGDFHVSDCHCPHISHFALLNLVAILHHGQLHYTTIFPLFFPY